MTKNSKNNSPNCEDVDLFHPADVIGDELFSFRNDEEGGKIVVSDKPDFIRTEDGMEHEVISMLGGLVRECPECKAKSHKTVFLCENNLSIVACSSCRNFICLTTNNLEELWQEKLS